MWFQKRKPPDTSSPAADQRKGNQPMPPVKIFALSTCSHCRNTRRFLDENNVPYECVEVDQQSPSEREQVIAQVRQYNPNLSFPTIIIGEKVIVGFREKEIREALGI